MDNKSKEILNYWDDPQVESMYDKNLITSEIRLISSKLSENSKILDAGCGEGEGTYEYSRIKKTLIHAVDFSETRLSKAKQRILPSKNVIFKKVDFLKEYELDNDYDFVISQRFLINLMEWDLQKEVIIALSHQLKKGGRLIMLEGSEDGVNELNSFRALFGLNPISVKWHNLFFRDDLLEEFLEENNLKLIEKDGLGSYFFLTRGVRPIFDEKLNWDSEYNNKASDALIEHHLGFRDKFSRLKLWVVEK